MEISEKAKHILGELNAHGYEAYIVGGAVRDLCLGKEPHDWDITTNARPDEVKKIFSHTLDTGIKHGTVTVMDGNEGFEVTTYRRDGKYSDGRHPDEVSFADSLTEDLQRRDFTINAMAMDKDGMVIDPEGGLRDIERGVIRTVGVASERFKEDALRMLRASRFSSTLGFSIDHDTFSSMKKNAHLIENVSKERIRDELTKLLMGKLPDAGIIFLYESGILDEILPEVSETMECGQNSPYHNTSVGLHTMNVLMHLRGDKDILWAGLLHDIGKPLVKTVNPKTGYDLFAGHPEKSAELAERILTRLKFPNKEKAYITELVLCHDFCSSKPSVLRRFAGEHGREFIEDLFKLKNADAKGHAKSVREELAKKNGELYEKIDGYLKDGSAIKPSDLNITGEELMELGIRGKAIGEFLQRAYNDCLGTPEHNTNEMLRRTAGKSADRLARKYGTEKEIER